jgi:putative DNA primase/helicase
VTLEQFLARFAEVVDEADGWLVPCPSHADSHPSLRVAVGETGALLLKCRTGCTTPDVVKALGMSWPEFAAITPGTVKARATSRNVPADPAAVAALAVELDGYAAGIQHSAAIPTLEYALERFGIDYADAQRLGLGYAGPAVYEDRRLVSGLPGGPRLVVPFRDRDGVPRGYQARALDPNAKVRWLGAKSPEGASWSKLAYFPGAAGWAEVIVTEGPGDGLTACAVGYDVIAVRGAGLLAESYAEEIAAIADGRPVVIVGDADNAGDGFAKTLAAKLAALGVSVRKVRPPSDGDDVTSWREGNPATFASDFVRAVNAAQDPGGLRTRLEVWTENDVTDIAAAHRLKAHLEANGSGMRFSPEVGFLLLHEGVWRVDKLDAVRTEAQEVARSIWSEVDSLTEALKAIDEAGDPDDSAKELRKRVGLLRTFARHANSSRGIDAMVREAQALKGVAADVNDFDKQPHLLACLNGVVDMRSGALLPHDPAYLLTRRVELDYDPEAKCNRWEQFLREVFPHERHVGMPQYMARIVGYGVTGETAEQCFAVMWGTGANGKSVLTDTLTEVFREHTVTTPFSTFEDSKGGGGIPNDLAALKGARLVMAAEGEQGRPMAEAVLKRVTGRDLISARFMRKEFFEFRPTFLLMLATNYKPNFKGQDEGLWRRVKLIPFERTFKPHERDHKLGAKLLAEAQGILAWAVRGAIEWYRDGLQDPPAIVDGTKEYRQTSDALSGFLPGVFVHDEKGSVATKLVWDAYRQWCDDEAMPERSRWTRKTLLAALEERGAYQKRANTGMEMRGIRRARATDHAPDITAPDSSDEDRTADNPLAHSSRTTPITGPSIYDL